MEVDGVNDVENIEGGWVNLQGSSRSSWRRSSKRKLDTKC